MHLARKNPQFDMSMELLCSLPFAPANDQGFARCADLISDFAMDKIQPLYWLVQSLQTSHGIKILAKNGNYKGKKLGRVMAIAQESEKLARAAASEYWAKVYE